MRIILLVTLLVLCTPGCPKKRVVLPSNPPNTICQALGKWTQPPQVYIEHGHDTLTTKAENLTLSAIQRLHMETAAHYVLATDINQANLQIGFYYAPWTTVPTLRAYETDFSDALIIEYDQQSKNTSATAITNWPPPTPSHNYAGLTYLRMDNTTRAISKAQVWINTYPLSVKPNSEPVATKHAIVHELGHAFGFGHAADTGHVMSATGWSPPWYTQGELQLIQWLYGK